MSARHWRRWGLGGDEFAIIDIPNVLTRKAISNMRRYIDALEMEVDIYTEEEEPEEPEQPIDGHCSHAESEP